VSLFSLFFVEMLVLEGGFLFGCTGIPDVEPDPPFKLEMIAVEPTTDRKFVAFYIIFWLF
jgi:hypothetical protein